MHDPLTVAFTIPRPWPLRREHPLSKLTPRWSIRRQFWSLAGRWYLYWPDLITVWHVEPGGRDSGDVCPHYHRTQRPDGTRSATRSNRYRWHVHHWRIQVHPLQNLRRQLLTRCAWCAGPSRRADRVCVSHGWDRDRGPWWRGERDLFHMDCSSADHAARSCTCTEPILDHDGWGRCARCGHGYGLGRTEAHTAVMRLLKTCPMGQRPTAELMSQVHGVREQVGR